MCSEPFLEHSKQGLVGVLVIGRVHSWPVGLRFSQATPYKPRIDLYWNRTERYATLSWTFSGSFCPFGTAERRHRKHPSRKTLQTSYWPRWFGQRSRYVRINDDDDDLSGVTWQNYCPVRRVSFRLFNFPGSKTVLLELRLRQNTSRKQRAWSPTHWSAFCCSVVL